MRKRLVHALVTVLIASVMIVTPVLATPQDKVDDLKEKKEAAEAQAESVNQELVGLLLDYDALKLDIGKQEEKIEKADKDLKKAEKKEREQYEAMKLRIKYMYEEGDSSFIETLFSSKDFSDLVSKAEYVQNVHNYDRNKLTEYVETKEEVAELKLNLETDQAEMEALADEMEIQKGNLESTLSTMRAEIANFDEQLEAAEAEVQAELERIARETAAAEEAARQEAEDQASEPDPTPESNNNDDQNNNDNQDSSQEEDDEEEIPAASPGNASLGQKIANKGCEYIGNPYVYGGNSLTGGIDCSGFTSQIHAKFGISVPRSSYSQRYGGKAVSYADKLPGDIICYSGHVAIYIGNNSVVHASNSAPYPKGGIKISSPANYRTVLAVRRYW